MSCVISKEDVDYQEVANEFYTKFGIDVSNGADLTVRSTFNTETGEISIISVDSQ